MTDSIDLDRSGHGFQKVRTYLGPSLGWVDEYVQPTRFITVGGTSSVEPGDSVILIDVASAVTLLLPDVRVWVQQAAYQPATALGRFLSVKDMGGNASSFNITIVPFGNQRIDDIAQPVVVGINRASVRLLPMNDLTGWIIEATAVSAVPGGGDVFKAGNNTYTGVNNFTNTVTAPTVSLDDDSTNVATTEYVQGQDYAPLANPFFTGNPQAPTALASDSDLTIANTAWVNLQGYITTVVASATFQPLDGDLTAIAALTGTNTIYYRSGTSAWTPVVIGSGLTFAGGTLTSAGGGNVSNSGTPTNGQLAQWTDATHIQGIAASTLGFQPLDGDLTALSALSGTNIIYYRSGTDIWSPVVIGTNLTFSGGVLSAAGGGGGVTDAEYVVAAVHAGLSAERLLTDTATVTWDFTTPGQVKANTAAGGGNVSNSGTPTVNQYAKWVTATTIQGVAAATVLSDAGGAPLASPIFTGDPTAPTPATADNDTSVATTAFVKAQGYLTSAAASTTYAPIASPTFTGDPKAPTPATADNDTSIATTAYVQAQSYITLTFAAATYAPLNGPVFTGDPRAPTPTAGDNDTSLATTAFVAAAVAAVGAGGVSPPQGRLTLQTGTPVMITTQSAKTAIFYSPYIGNQIPLYNGTAFTMTTFAELTVATTDATKSPAAVGVNQMLDWFVWNDVGVIRVGHGPPWTNDTTRSAGTALVKVNGIWLNNASITNGPAAQRGTYVGTTRSNASSQLNWTYGAVSAGATAGLFAVWNCYNRRLVSSLSGDTTDSWTLSSTWVAHSATMRHSFVCGLAEDAFRFEYTALMTGDSASYCSSAVGYDSTTVPSGTPFWIAPAYNAQGLSIHNTTALGFHFGTGMETSPVGVTATSSGDSGAPGFIQTGIWFHGWM